MRGGVRLAIVVFVVAWLPLTLWRGIAMGRSFRIGAAGQDASGPLIDAVIQMGFVMLAPALFVALLAFALWSWREERRSTSRTKQR